MKLKEAIERCNELIKEKHANWIGLISQEAISTVLQEIERLQKENEELKNENELLQENYTKCFEDLNWVLTNYIHKDRIRKKIKKLNADNGQDTEIVKRYEEMRRNSQDSFYRNSYQKSIHELNTKRSMRKMFISILENLLKEE